MKVDNKQINSDIYQSLLNLANEVFEYATVNEGSYTLSNIVKLIKERKLLFNKKFKDEETNVEVGRFKCSFYKSMVFELLQKFERLAGIKKKAVFSRLSDDKLLATFNITIKNVDKSLLNVLNLKKSITEILSSNILLVPDKNVIVASDGQILSVRPVEINEVSALCDMSSEYIFLSPKMIKEGTYSISFYANNTDTTRIVHAHPYAGGETLVYSYGKSKYPNWERVIPETVVKEGYFKFESPLAFTRWLSVCTGVKFSTEKKPCVKFTNAFLKEYPFVELSFTVGSDEVSASLPQCSTVQQSNFKLSFQSAHTFVIKLYVAHLASIPSWTGGIWIESDSHVVLLDSSCERTVNVAIPYKGKNESTIYRISGESLPYQERHKFLQQKESTIKNIELKAPVKEPGLFVMKKSKSEKRYSLDELAKGNYKVREGNHNPELYQIIRSMAQYMLGRNELQVKVIQNFERKYGTPKSNPDFFLHYPLPEMDLALCISEIFEQEGIDEIPEYVDEVQEESAITMQRPEPVTEEPEIDEEEIEEDPVEEEAVEEIEEAAEESDEEISTDPSSESIRFGLRGGTCIIPAMELETSEGSIIVTTYDNYCKIYDSHHPKDRELANVIDACISTETFNAEPIDINAIAAEVEQFFIDVENETAVI